MSDATNIQDWGVVYTYSTKDAVEDGVLVCLSEIAAMQEIIQPFFRLPVYATAGLVLHVSRAVDAAGGAIDVTGVWHDIAWMAWNAIKRAPRGTTKVCFKVAIWEDNRNRTHDLMVGICSYDTADPRPVITICFTHED